VRRLVALVGLLTWPEGVTNPVITPDRAGNGSGPTRLRRPSPCYIGRGMKERRSAPRQESRVDGRRDTDPRLTTSDCAQRLGVSTQFIVGEIREGRLRALVIQRGRRRAMYRIAPADLAAYLRQHRWTTTST
jgi:excisionase family DNA binding protein